MHTCASFSITTQLESRSETIAITCSLNCGMGVMSRTVGLQKRCVFTSVRFWPFRPLVDYTWLYHHAILYWVMGSTRLARKHITWVAGTYFFTPRIDGLHRPPAGLLPGCVLRCFPGLSFGQWSEFAHHRLSYFITARYLRLWNRSQDQTYFFFF